ncbi:DUF817 family protein [Streptomyces sp. TRM76323]|uniref:DUF817 family protein n=1 Tax=Streptomyces tamarix TaxID=3078565 RepID=A0ABU3QGD5_9ACTN|nr:DUF817 family protein [Streptomyces tamarix]MDT9681826.1 DUF817 family protein [Streptomyces tamarix]
MPSPRRSSGASGCPPCCPKRPSRGTTWCSCTGSCRPSSPGGWWDTARDTGVIAACHVVGLLFVSVKVRLGSWSCPEEALMKVAAVPLYGRFLCAAVGSCVWRAWHLFDLRVCGYRTTATAVLAGAVYVNFLTRHWLPDLRWPLAAGLLLVTAGARVWFTVGARRYRMPLGLSFMLIGFSPGRRERRRVRRSLEPPAPGGRLATGRVDQVRGLGAADQRDFRPRRTVPEAARGRSHGGVIHGARGLSSDRSRFRGIGWSSPVCRGVGGQSGSARRRERTASGGPRGTCPHRSRPRHGPAFGAETGRARGADHPAPARWTAARGVRGRRWGGDPRPARRYGGIGVRAARRTRPPEP